MRNQLSKTVALAIMLIASLLFSGSIFGQKTEMIEISFEPNSAEVSAKDSLRLIKIDPKKIVSIDGFASIEGSPFVNKQLSMQRAVNVARICKIDGYDSIISAYGPVGTYADRKNSRVVVVRYRL